MYGVIHLKSLEFLSFLLPKENVSDIRKYSDNFENSKK